MVRLTLLLLFSLLLRQQRENAEACTSGRPLRGTDKTHTHNSSRSFQFWLCDKTKHTHHAKSKKKRESTQRAAVETKEEHSSLFPNTTRHAKTFNQPNTAGDVNPTCRHVGPHSERHCKPPRCPMPSCCLSRIVQRQKTCKTPLQVARDTFQPPNEGDREARGSFSDDHLRCVMPYRS